MSTPKYSRLDPGQRRDADPRRCQRAVRRARLRRCLDRGHRQRRRRHPRARPPLLRRSQGRLHRAARAARRPARAATPAARRSQRPRARGRPVSRWLDWTEANRTIWLATIAPGEDIADPDVRQVVADLVRRAVALLAEFHADIAEDSPRLRHALECWTGLNRAATRRWLQGKARQRPSPTRACSPTAGRASTTFARSTSGPSGGNGGEMNLRQKGRPLTFVDA